MFRTLVNWFRPNTTRGVDLRHVTWTRVTNMMTCTSTLTLTFWLKLTWYPPQAQILKMMLLKKVCSTSTLHLTDYSLNRTAANQIVPAEKKLCVAVHVGGWIQMIPKIIIFGYKDYTVSTKKQLQLAKHAGRKWQREAQQLPTLFAIWSCTKNGKLWLI